jgi:hypothetical protein
MGNYKEEKGRTRIKVGMHIRKDLMKGVLDESTKEVILPLKQKICRRPETQAQK